MNRLENIGLFMNFIPEQFTGKAHRHLLGEGEGGEGFFEKNFCPDFDAEYNGEIEIWIRLPILQQNSD